MRSNNSRHVVDCSRPASFAFWFIIGAALTLMAMTAQGAGNWASMLRVGSTNPALTQIERELGPIHSPDPIGHDGQLYYVIARDPFAVGNTARDLAAFDNNGPSYRYRRILFPLLAGGFGQFGGKATLAGMVLLVLLGMGLATVAIADVAGRLSLKGGSAFLASFNIGSLLSAMILTGDALALGLALSGLALSLRQRFGLAIAAFALAALTKEVYVLVPFGLAPWHLKEDRFRIAASTAIIPVLPLTAWAVWVWIFVPETFSQTRHLGLPLTGIVTSAGYWQQLVGRNYVQLFLAGYALLTTALAAVTIVIGRRAALRCLAVPWVLLALCSTAAVWRVPGNAARAFSILWPVGILLVSERLRPQPRPSIGEMERRG